MSRQFRTDQHRGEARKLPFNGYAPYSPDLRRKKKQKKPALFSSLPLSSLPPPSSRTHFMQAALLSNPSLQPSLSLHQQHFFLVKSHNQQHFSATFLTSLRSRVLQLATVKVGGQLAIVRVGGQLATVKSGGQLGSAWVGGQVFYVISKSSYIAHFWFFGTRVPFLSTLGY